MKLLFILPCYNEEAVLQHAMPVFIDYFHKLIADNIINKQSRICFIDDGSSDRTWEYIDNFTFPECLGIKFSTNFGHQKALLAGMETYSGVFDAFVTLDADLQDDYTIIPDMIQKIVEGNDIVYGVRNDRTNDSFIKKTTAQMFYWTFQKLGVKSIRNAADFRMITQKANEAFLRFPEKHLFLRAVFPAIGLKSDIVYFKRQKREQGETKYPFSKMVSFAWEGITSFSTKPLKWVLGIGIITTLVALVLFLWATIQLILGNTIKGWFSMLSMVLFFGGIQTLALGIIGEYVGKIFEEVKNRPRYIVEKTKSNS